MALGSCEIPVIDLNEEDLQGQGRTKIIQQISKACEKHGMFQVVNHGVPEKVMENMMTVAKEFFDLPFEDRAQYYGERDPQKPPVTSAGRSYNDKEGAPMLAWLEYLGHPCHPVEDASNSWPEKPEKYREVTKRYASDVMSLEVKLMKLLSEGLGLESCYIEKQFGKQDQQMKINYYPPCPDPSVKTAIHGHTDASGITILQQGGVAGLEVMIDGEWVIAKYIPTAFIVILADHLEVISNGRFKSAKHRAITNSSKTRISIPTFYIPSLEAFIAPAESLVTEDSPARYRGYIAAEFYKIYGTKDLTKEDALDEFRI